MFFYYTSPTYSYQYNLALFFKREATSTANFVRLSFPYDAVISWVPIASIWALVCIVASRLSSVNRFFKLCRRIFTNLCSGGCSRIIGGSCCFSSRNSCVPLHHPLDQLHSLRFSSEHYYINVMNTSDALKNRVFIKYCLFYLKFCDFSELCQFCCSDGFLPAWWVYTHWHRGNTESRIFL